MTIYRTPTGVIDYETCTDNFLYRPKHVNNSFSGCESFTFRYSRRQIQALAFGSACIWRRLYRSEPLATKKHMYILSFFVCFQLEKSNT